MFDRGRVMSMEDINMKWVKLKKYCELSGDTPHAVHARRRKGIWLDGLHTRLAGDRRLWVNLEAVEKWIESGPNTETCSRKHKEAAKHG